jgi:hypothetical protein
MAGNGSESYTFRSVDSEHIPRGPEEEMAVRLALRRSREEARVMQRSNSFRQKSITPAQMVHGSGARCAIAASPEAVRSVWRSNAVADAQPLRWRTEAMDAPWASSDDNMTRRARHARLWV